MTEPREIYAYFWIAADELPHQDISSALKLEPTEYWDKGDPGKYIQQQKQARWVYRSPLPSSEMFLDSHLAAVVDVLQERSEQLKALKNKYEVGINCVGYYTEANPGFHLSEQLIQKCASLGLSVDFDLYCLGSDDDAV